MIDPHARFNGKYVSDRDLRIEGEAQGEIECQGTLIISPQARVRSAIKAHNVIINGDYEGDVDCGGRFEVGATGRVKGAVKTQVLVVKEGAHWEGSVTMTREAALMGIPTFTLFAGKMPAVDTWLENQGMLARLTEPTQLAGLAPRASQPRTPPALGERAAGEGPVPTLASRSSDEIGKLAQSFEEMARRIRQQIQELEAISASGHEISTIGPDGLAGVLRRITDRAAELLQVDVCLVMLRNEQMGCWVVEAASGEWNEKLDQTVMLWEEFPICVQAFESRQPAFGENVLQDGRPEVLRRNLIGQSMLSIPLLFQGSPFGVLVLLQERVAAQEDWQACLRLAKGFADEAAIAIANARLYEALSQKEKGLESRLRELEHLAETLAHDLKAPGERMESLASLLLKEYGGALDERATKWLRLIEANGRDLTDRVHTILEVARLGAPREAVEAVDPALVLNEVLKAWAGELERRQVRVQLDPHFPMVACHRAYLRQVFDNLISNAVNFSGDRPDPIIRITAERTGDRVQFSVTDNGVGIPPQQRERVFEAFVRLSPSSTKGSGIGLAIVKRLVELYGGKVWIESNELAGCTVRFTLPVLGDLSRRQASAMIETVQTEL